jgi:hypothetical protein
MGLTSPTATAPTDPPPIAGPGRRFSRSAALLDLVGLLALAWMLGLWQLGTFQPPAADPTGAPRLPSIPAFPGFADLSRRGEIGLALLVFTVLTAIVVLVRLGRPVGWVRPLAAAPLLILLLGIGVWRFVVCWPLLLKSGQVYGFSPSAGLWDGAVVALGLAAAVLLVVRPERASRSRRVIVIVAVTVAVTVSLIEAARTYVEMFGDGEDTGRYAAAILLPPLILALVGAAMAPGWLQGMQRGHLSAAAALLTWGLVIGGGVAVPTFLLQVFSQGRGLIDTLGQFRAVAGLDWLESALAVAAAALIAPVAREYRAQDRAGRRQILRGPLAVLAILLFAHLGGLLLQDRLIGEPSAEQAQLGIGTDPADQWIPLLGLVGAVLVLLVAIWPQRRSALWTMAAGVLLITGPSAWHLAPQLGDGGQLQPFDFGAGIPSLMLWEGVMIMLIFVLPLFLLALLLIGGRAPADPGPTDQPPPKPSQEPV